MVVCARAQGVFQNLYLWAFSAVLFGLLYIPAFMYGFFWLWIAPFTAVIIFFLRAMIDDAIARVAKKGDAAVQAKAMIPEFIKMNIVMTVLLSLPFVSALWLNHAGHIQVIQQSAVDQELWRFCLWILKSLDEVKRIEIPAVQILLSNMLFFFFGGITLWVFAYTKMKTLFLVLFDKGTYKFLNCPPRRPAGFKKFLIFPVIIVFIIIISWGNSFVSINYPYFEMLKFCVFLNFSNFSIISYVVALCVEDSIRWKNLEIKWSK